jgi:REP element-mobilizing transposase RayT
MARRLRLHAPGAFYHVTLRGNHQQPIFFRNEDRDLMERVIADSLERSVAKVHAYCWMTNHVHLLIQVSDVPLGRLMLRIASTYARTVQLQLQTTGHLFERRYHATLVDADNYLLAVLRYIHLNPVMAGLVSNPGAYPWSSHRVYLGLADTPWVTTTFTLGLLASRPETALHRYQMLMTGEGRHESGLALPKPHRRQPQILGDDAFVARVMKARIRPPSGRSLEDLITECSRRFKISTDLLVSRSRTRNLARARAWLGHQAVTERVASVCAVARTLGRCESAIRQVMSRYPAAQFGE